MAGNNQIVKLYENKSQAVLAAVDKIAVEIFNKKSTATASQCIVLTGCSPLSGTTTTCISLGIAFANTGRKTLLVDCDVRKAIQYKKLNEETTTGLADYLTDEEGAKCGVNEIIYETNIDNLEYIPCGNYFENATRVLCSQKMERLIEAVRKHYDYIVFDFPSINIVPDVQIMFKSVDGIISVAALGETRKKQIKDVKRKISSYEDKYYGMIVNKIPRDVYKRNVKDFDYYFLDEQGEQNLGKNIKRGKRK